MENTVALSTLWLYFIIGLRESTLLHYRPKNSDYDCTYNYRAEILRKGNYTILFEPSQSLPCSLLTNIRTYLPFICFGTVGGNWSCVGNWNWVNILVLTGQWSNSDLISVIGDHFQAVLRQLQGGILNQGEVSSWIFNYNRWLISSSVLVRFSIFVCFAVASI